MFRSTKRLATQLLLLLISGGYRPVLAHEALGAFSNSRSGELVKKSRDLGNFVSFGELRQAGFTDEQMKMFQELSEYIEEEYVDPVQRKKLYYGAVRGMIKQLDPNSVFYTPEEYQGALARMEKDFSGIGEILRPKDRGELAVVDLVLPGSPAERAGLGKGDKILAIDEQDVRAMSFEEALGKLRGEPGTKVDLRVLRGEAGFEIAVVRDSVAIPTMRGEMLAPDVGYIQIESFRPNSYEIFLGELGRLQIQGMRRLVVDLRKNNGGYLSSVVNICSLFLKKGQLIVSEYRKGRRTGEYSAETDGRYGDLPLIVLVDGGTLSAGEIFAGVMQDYRRAPLVGSKTYGKGTVQDILNRFGDGSALKLTTGEYYLPSGRSIDRTLVGRQGGLDPDVAVPLSSETDQTLAAGLRMKLMGVSKSWPAADDLALERALDILASQGGR